MKIKVFARLYEHGIHCKINPNKIVSHQIGTVFHAKVVRQILVLFISSNSSEYIILVLNYIGNTQTGGTTLLPCPFGYVSANHDYISMKFWSFFFPQYFCNLSHSSYEKYIQDQIIQDASSQKARNDVK